MCVTVVSDGPQVSDSSLALNQTVEENLVQLESTFKEQTDYVAIVQKLQGQLDELVRLIADVPFWSNTAVSLEELAQKTEAFDFYRYEFTVLMPRVCRINVSVVPFQVVGLPGSAALRCAHLPPGSAGPDSELQKHSDWVRRPAAPPSQPKLNPCFCLSLSVCLLGVLTLIISWGSLGLELAVAAVSVAMATRFPLQ